MTAKPPAERLGHRQCTVCQHPRRGAIELELAQGGTQTAVAGRYQLTKFTVHRHWQNHVADSHKSALRLGSDAGTVDVGKLRDAMRSNTLPDLLDLKARLWGALDRAKAAGNLQIEGSLIGRALQLEESIARATGALRGDAVTVAGVINVNVYAELRGGLVQVLKTHPSAREALLEFLRGFDDKMARLETGVPAGEVIDAVA